MSTIFEERYKKLNPRQKEAVDTIEGPVMVIAGPGTGKTTILTLRIANILLKTDTTASGILAITFTEAGVKAMRMKLREVIGAKADEVRIHTFHGFAASVINEFADHFPHIARAKQLSAIEADALIRDILRDAKFFALRPFGNPDLYISSIISNIADAKKEAWTPQVIREFALTETKRIESDESSISTRGATKGKLKAEALKRIEKCEKTILFADVYEAYETKKREKKAIDFDDLIIELLIALKRDELLLRLVQEKFLYILVDEHQDTNDSQNLLIRMMADFFDSPNLFVVGDEKQAIYRFQGASVDNFLTFQGAWRDMKIISLSDNYRSHQGILDAGFSLIENNYADGEHESLRVKLSSGSGAKKAPIDLAIAQDTESSLEYLADRLWSMLKEDKEKTAAVIVRTNRDVERVLDVLESRGIPAIAERGADIFTHPLGSIFFDLVEFLADRSKTELLARTIAVGLWNLDFSSSVRIIQNIRSGNVASIEKDIPALKKLLKDISRSGAIEFLISAAALSGYTQKAVSDPLCAEVWRGIVSLAQDIARRDSISDPSALIDALLSFRSFAETKTVKIFSGKTDANITITTAHGSKGLEYNRVYVPFSTEESWLPRARPSYFVLPKEREEGDHIKDIRRLYYVALTRAKESVSIILSRADDLGKELTPLRFIYEIEPSSLREVKIPDAKRKDSHEGKKSADRSAAIEFAKNSISERGLSVTALNHFCACPNLFYYKSILKVPEPPSASSEKGNAMHEAMSRVWHLKDKSEVEITNTIIEAVREHMGGSLLPGYEKEPILEELLVSAPLVAKALRPHLMARGIMLTETWMESTLRFKRESEDIECRLHGKLDAVVETEDKVLIFDYKTREALSTAAIKGETKNSDGGYFRQLVFYKILASDNPKYKGKSIEPSLVFIKPDEKGRCPEVNIGITPQDVERVKSEVVNLVESIWKGDILKKSCDDPDCDGCRLMRASD